MTAQIAKSSHPLKKYFRRWLFVALVILYRSLSVFTVLYCLLRLGLRGDIWPFCKVPPHLNIRRCHRTRTSFAPARHTLPAHPVLDGRPRQIFHLGQKIFSTRVQTAASVDILCHPFRTCFPQRFRALGNDRATNLRKIDKRGRGCV